MSKLDIQRIVEQQPEQWHSRKTSLAAYTAQQIRRALKPLIETGVVERRLVAISSNGGGNYTYEYRWNKPVFPERMTHQQFMRSLPATAETIASWKVENPDPYIQTIIHAARVLVAQGRGEYRYNTSWGGGGTHWSNGVEHTVVPPMREVEEDSHAE